MRAATRASTAELRPLNWTQLERANRVSDKSVAGLKRENVLPGTPIVEIEDGRLMISTGLPEFHD